MSPSLPVRLGRYDVVAVLGTGAFATVYRATDDRLGADVALKVLAENHSFDPDLRERFISEGRLLRRVDSPHVVTVFDIGETDAGQPFLVLDLATGGDLAARRRSLGPAGPGLDDVLAVARQVAAALGALHGQRVVHRDITPANLLVRSGPAPGPVTALLSPGEQVVLADLGLSKDLAVASGLTVGTGTAGFTPPEQGSGGWVDSRADIWSASALLVWLALGVAPPTEERWADHLRARRWPERVIGELRRGLDPVPDRRHATAEEWARALDAAARPPVAVPAEATVGPPEAPAATGGVVASRRRRWLIAAAGLLTVLALVGAWLLGRSDDDAAPYGSTRTEQLADGQARSTTGDGEAEVAITGPVSAEVGQALTFTATTSGIERWEWLAPDGRSYADEPTLQIESSSAGDLVVRLLGQTAEGDVWIAEHRVEVTGG